MKMALIYDPLNDIDLFAWGLSFDHDIYEMAISFKPPVKIIPPTKQRLVREGLRLILLGFDGSLLKISRTPQNLKEKAPYGFRFSVFAISIPQLRAHAGAVAGSRLVRRDLYSFCFSSVPPTAARPGSAPQATCYSAVLRIRATFKARLERCLGV